MSELEPEANLSGAPDWFNSILQKPRKSVHTQTQDNRRLHYLDFNDHDTQKPPLLFLHGYKASCSAWEFIAPYFTDSYRCYALDFSGMGDSEHLVESEYSIHTFTKNIATVVDEISNGQPVTIVAHSFGGLVGLHYLKANPSAIERIILTDVYITFPGDPPHGYPNGRGRAVPYPDYDSIIARYVLSPPQPAYQWVLNYMAHNAIRRVDGGWKWKFDVNMPLDYEDKTAHEILTLHRDRCDIICGEHSLVMTPERREKNRQCLGEDRALVVIPDSYHHIMLDQPIALIATLRAMLRT